jgi:DNA repair protein RecO (recombination protein O)
MLIKTRGIILRTLKYGETSLIMDIYTENYGLNSYIVGGVRNKKSTTKSGSLQIMSLVEIVAYHKSAKTLYRIKEISALILYQSIPFEILRSSVGMFMIEILKNTLKDNEENPELFYFIYNWFIYLDQTKESVANLHLNFMLSLSEYIGIQPRDNYSVNNPIFDLREGQFIARMPDHPYFLDESYSELLYDYMMQERESVHELSCSNTQRRFLLEKLIQFYKLHVDSIKELHTHQILNEILA